MQPDEFNIISKNVKIALDEKILSEIPENPISDDELIDRLLVKIHDLESKNEKTD